MLCGKNELRGKLRAVGDSLETREEWLMEGRGQEDKKRCYGEGECERESSDGVISLQRSSDKQRLRASEVK